MRKISALVVSFVFIFSFFCVQPARANDVGGDETYLLTTNLLQLVKVYMKAEALGKPAMMAKIVQVIDRRKAKLVAMLENDPAKVEKHLLPFSLLDSFPPEIKELLEVEFSGTGELNSMVSSDFDKGTSKAFHDFVSPHGKVLKVYFIKNAPSVSGVKGVLTGRLIDTSVLAADGSTFLSTSTTTTTVVAVTAQRRALGILVNFPDSVTSVTPTAVMNSMFNDADSVDKYFQQQSFGQMGGFTGIVIGPVTITSLASSCDSWTWASQADVAAKAAGYDPATYDRVLYLLAPINCGWAGLGELPGNQTWYKGSYSSNKGVLAHELGHNEGRHHAALGDPRGTYSEYGDVKSAMGLNYREFNAPQKVESGWIPAARQLTVTGTGTYSLYKTESTDGVSPQILMVKRPEDTTYTNYYISYRVPEGLVDTALGTLYGYKTDVHLWDGLSWNNKTFAQMSSGLDDGQSFVDSVNGITITQVSHDANRSTVSVTAILPPCTKNAPTVTVSPASISKSAGQTAAFTATIKNNDTSSCSDSTFNLSSTLPAGWSATYSPTYVLLTSAAQTTVTWNVTSSSATLDGSYPVILTATDAQDINHKGEGSASFVLFTDRTAPTVTLTSPANGATIGGKVTLSATASDDVGVAKVEFYMDGTLLATDTSSPFSHSLRNTRKISSGPHKFVAKAYDASGNVGVSPEISVTKA